MSASAVCSLKIAGVMKPGSQLYQPAVVSQDSSAFIELSSILSENDSDCRDHVFEQEVDNPESDVLIPPFEISQDNDDDVPARQSAPEIPWMYFQDPWILSLSVTFFMALPVQVGIARLWFKFTCRMFVVLPIWMHTLTSVCAVRMHMNCILTPFLSSTARVVTSAGCLLDVLLFQVFYRRVMQAISDTFFTEPDGTVVIEWTHDYSTIQFFLWVGRLTVVSRLIIATLSWLSRFLSSECCCCFISYLPRSMTSIIYFSQQGCGRRRQVGPHRMRSHLYLVWLANVFVFVSGMLLSWSIGSAVIHFYPWSAPVINDEGCDFMDLTECWLPFPSFEFMERDASTVTGWRVNLNGSLLPPLKGRISMDPSFLSLDGFSTGGSIMFYHRGLKEAKEAGIQQLPSHAKLESSITSKSVTLLIDVNSSTLVAHSAEIDYLDPIRPLVLIFPAQPLHHARHYAVALVNASDHLGNPLDPSLYLASLWTLLDTSTTGTHSNTPGMERARRFQESVIPALIRAAPWCSTGRNDISNLQMLFDFVTVSEEAQLTPVRSVRDAVLNLVNSTDWELNPRVQKRVEYTCSRDDDVLARTIHAEIDVPWFLDAYGPGHRGAVLDNNAISSGIPTVSGVAKFVVHIPCSIRAAALDIEGARPLRSIVEYGHGLFFSRQEALDHFLLQMAHDEGYVLLAMDWRGMSVFDLPIMVKVLLFQPRLFQAVRDNLIQGYANKYAMLHFAKNDMQTLDWLHFETENGIKKKTPTFHKSMPTTHVFYGISQGGILGAGYAALSGVTGLLDRVVLGVPGTPFDLIMSRSLDFTGYDALLLLNFYNNRHVRALLAIVQMAWDSVEGSGVLAPPLREPIPRMLLQAGLGDVVVPTFAAEVLARGLNASMLPNAPRTVYNIPIFVNASDSLLEEPDVTLTEILYEEEFASLPIDNIRSKSNSVHVCVRRDAVMIDQITEFINSGRVVDVCVNGGCVRQHSC